MSTPEEVQEPKSKVPPMPPKQADSAATAELHRRFCSDVPNDGTYTLHLNETETIRFFAEADRLIAAHVAAATAKERQARELAEGERVEARKGWAYFAGWSASSQKYEVCHWQGRDSNVPKFDTLEAAWEEAERRSIAARVNGLMPLAPAVSGERGQAQ